VRILILGMNYLPESASIGPYTADLAEYLQKRGHQVRVVTSFPMAPQWRIWEGYRREWFRCEIVNGIMVTRTFTFVPREPRRAINRVLYDMSFSLSAIVGALLSGPCDAILVISPPLQIGVTGWLISKIRRVPFFFHIQDLVPDAAVATGLLTEKSIAVKIARGLEKFIYRRAHSMGVICDGFRQNLLSKQVPPSKIRLMPNSIEVSR
jgi:colanic acid biosynthesis glycosyl transferase WcaI